MGKRDERLKAEIENHLRMAIQDRIARGESPAEAEANARREFGNETLIKETTRDMWSWNWLEQLLLDARYGLRAMRRNPSVSVIVIGMLALGMGASTLVFSIFQSALLKPLPFRDPNRLVYLSETRLDRGIDHANFGEANFWDVRTQNHSFEEVAAYHYDEANLTGNGAAEKVTAISVTAGFFRTLGVQPVLGRDLSYDDEQGGGQHVVVVGNRFWKERFGGDPNILGKTLRLSGKAWTVVGVLPPGEPWIHHQLYVPFGYRPNADRGSWEYDVIARLKPGVSPDAARADLQRIAATLGHDYPADDKGIGFVMDPSSTWVASDETRRALWVLLGAVTFLLLIACTNSANLLLARGLARRREIAVRTALGAGRSRLVRIVMTESILLSAFGAALGLIIASGGLRAIQALEISGVPRLAEASLNPWVLTFALSLALLTGVLSGLAPALQAPAGGIATALRDGDRQTGSRGQGRLRAALVTVEVALSFLLLVGAGLLIRSFNQLTGVDNGFQAQNRLVFSVSMPGSYYQKGVGKQFLDRFFERLAADPNVIASGAVSHRPVEGGNPGMGIDASSPARADQRPPWAGWRIVTPGYFKAVGLPLLHGRLFDESDKPVWTERGQPDPPRRVVISDRLAKRIFPDQDPVGKHVSLWKGQNGMDAEVIGTVGDSRERGPATGPTLTVYIAYGANALPSEFVVHTRSHPLALAPTVRSLVASLDPDLPVADVRSFEDVIQRSVAPQRLNVILLVAFGGLSLLLATSGIYGVLSYSMSRRTAEIGLRMALGASRANIVGLTIGQGLRPALLGTALGLIGAWWLSRYMTTLLFGVKPFDAATHAAAVVLLVMTALVACYLPGRRAMRTDPVTALRAD